MGNTNPKMMMMVFEDDGGMGIPVLELPFWLQINPESYSESVSLNYSEIQVPGTVGDQTKYNNTGPHTLQFEFLMDATGALGQGPANSADLKAKIEHFKRVALHYDGNVHRPHFLRLLWGTLLFDCRLKRLSINYKLFDKEGLPLRAVLNTHFVEYNKKKDRKIANERNSPDLTHVRTVQEGDTLPLMTYRIYGDSKYYLAVARFNGITNFRKLTTGEEIVFPPLKN